MRLLKTSYQGKQLKWFPSIFFGTMAGIIIAALLLLWAGVENVWNNIQSVDYVPFSIFIGLVICTNFLRSWRFRVLVRKGTLVQMNGIVSVHTLLINLLPFGSGEISFPILLRRYGISDRFMQGIPSLMIARFNDVLVNLALALIALIWVGTLGLVVDLARKDLVVFGGLLTLLLGVSGLILYKKLLKKFTITQRITRVIHGVILSFREVPPRVWGGAFIITVAIRIVSLISVFYLLESIGLSLPVPFVFLYTSLYVFLPLLPINSVAGLGITEAYSTAIFVFGGIGQAAATAASVQIHALQLLVALIIGIIGFALLQYLKWRSLRRVLEPTQPLA